MRIKEQLQHIIKNSLKKLNIDKKLTEISLEISKVPDCDYTSNISFSLTRELHQKPEEIANTLKNIIPQNKIINRWNICKLNCRIWSNEYERIYRPVYEWAGEKDKK